MKKRILIQTRRLKNILWLSPSPCQPHLRWQLQAKLRMRAHSNNGRRPRICRHQGLCHDYRVFSLCIILFTIHHHASSPFFYRQVCRYAVLCTPTTNKQTIQSSQAWTKSLTDSLCSENGFHRRKIKGQIIKSNPPFLYISFNFSLISARHGFAEIIRDMAYTQAL